MNAEFVENFMAVSTPGGIEAQEARGQVDMIDKFVLPKEIKIGEKKTLLDMGVEYLEDENDLFVSVKFPKGWELRASDCSMWSCLYDETGREIASIFYKA